MNTSSNRILLSVTLCLILGVVWWMVGRDHQEVVHASPSNLRSAQARERRSQQPASPWNPLIDDSLPREERLKLAGEIHSDLSPQEVDFLFSVLSRRPLAGEEEKWWVIMNEIMERMRKHGVGAERYSDVLSSLAVDSSQHPVARDYAIQHLTQWLAPVSPETTPHEVEPEKCSQALAKVVRAIRDQSSLQTSVPGTGLMALVDISPRIDKELADQTWADLQPFLTNLISGGDDAAVATRITAIQAVGIRGELQHLPSVRELAATDSIAPSVRLAAIASLGSFAKAEDRDLLSAIRQQGGKYQYAAEAALTKLPSP